MTDETAKPSPWVKDAIARYEPLGPGDLRILDLAAGRGRHTRHLLDLEYVVLAVDRDISGLRYLDGRDGFEALEGDLESGSPWPFAGEKFRAVIVTNYLYRSSLAQVISLVAPGGYLIYETFGIGNERFGRPSNPDFLARPHEIAEAAEAGGLNVLVDTHGEVETPRPAVLHRCAAFRKDA
ncbi:MAG: SAM-dependent methyltransferase [Alphaproteobacteria bacterium]|jgi:SAM-dependent methyltransferase